MAHLQLSPGLGLRVLQALRELAPLPASGIVAGQAVASIIDRMQGYRSAPVNDIDIFRPAGHKALARTTRTLAPTAILQQSAMPFAVTEGATDEQYYALQQFLHRMRSYRVSTVSRQGLLNFVNCTMPFEAGLRTPLTAARVLEAFDLNCVRVAVDLATGLLWWDRRYEAFLRHRRIEVCTVHTPWHTMLRAIRKGLELPNVWVDVEAVANIAAAYEQSTFHRVAAGHGISSMRFGDKLAEQAHLTRSYWSKYFELETVASSVKPDGQPIQVHQLVPRGQVDRKVQRCMDRLGAGALHLGGANVHALLRKPRASVLARVDCFEARLDANAGLTAAYFAANPLAYVSRTDSSAHTERVEAFLRRMPEFNHVFAGLTLDEQAHAVRFLNPLLRRHSPALLKSMAEQASPVDLRCDHGLSGLLDKALARAQAPVYARARPWRLPALPPALQGRLSAQLLGTVGEHEAQPRLGHLRDRLYQGEAMAVVLVSTHDAGPHRSLLHLKAKKGTPCEVAAHLLSGTGVLEPPAEHAAARDWLQRLLTKTPEGKPCKPVRVCPYPGV